MNETELCSVAARFHDDDSLVLFGPGHQLQIVVEGFLAADRAAVAVVHVAAALEKRGAAVPDYPPQPGTGSSGPSSRHSHLIEELALPAPMAAAFVDDLMVRVRKHVVASGCREYKVAHRSSGDTDEGFNLHYRRDATAGSITVFVVPTMYMLFARKEVPGANKAEAREQPLAPHHHGDLIAK